jgi:AdoMet-dependent rRNA methyltransferase SPB1
VHDFVSSDDPITMLTNFNAFHFKDEESKKYEKHALTNEDIKACLADLKVLNKKDFKSLLKWRQKMKTEFEVKIKKSGQDSGSGNEDEDGSGEEDVEARPLTEEEKAQQLQEEMELRIENMNKEAKKKDKKRREQRDKLRKRMAYQIEIDDEFTAPGAEEDVRFYCLLIHPHQSLFVVILAKPNCDSWFVLAIL